MLQELCKIQHCVCLGLSLCWLVYAFESKIQNYTLASCEGSKCDDYHVSGLRLQIIRSRTIARIEALSQANTKRTILD